MQVLRKVVRRRKELQEVVWNCDAMRYCFPEQNVGRGLGRYV